MHTQYSIQFLEVQTLHTVRAITSVVYNALCVFSFQLVDSFSTPSPVTKRYFDRGRFISNFPKNLLPINFQLSSSFRLLGRCHVVLSNTEVQHRVIPSEYGLTVISLQYKHKKRNYSPHADLLTTIHETV